MKLAQSLFVSNEIHKRQVTLPDGSVHELFFKELPAVEFRKFQLAEASEAEDVKAGSMAKLITASMVEEDGKPAITMKDALRLNSKAANAIIAAILEINGFGEQKNA